MIRTAVAALARLKSDDLPAVGELQSTCCKGGRTDLPGHYRCGAAYMVFDLCV